MEINVILPCLNEERAIGPTIQAVKNIAPAARILVVDNGSSDRTVEIASSLGVDVLYEPNKGKGFAFRRGIDNLDHDCKYVFMIDGDDTYEIKKLHEGIELINRGYDMVVGVREDVFEKTTNRSQHYRRGHKSGNQLLTFAFRKLFGITLTDTLSGWRLMSRGYVESFSGGASGFELEAELNVHAYTLSVGITELSIGYTGRLEGSHSKLNTYKDGWAILRRNLSLYKSERPSLAYSFLALPWLLISLVLGIRVGKTYLVTQLVPQFPSLIVGITSFIIAGNLWVTGMILEHVRLSRVQIARSIYKNNNLRIKS
jgi:glycosyltransferase involved in cell wall biosynthesis